MSTKTTKTDTTDPSGTTDPITESWSDLNLLAASVRMGVEGFQRLILHGPPGTGKTTLALAMARPSQPVYSVTCHEELSAYELFGYWDTVHSREWIPGIAARAWKEGGLLVLNEVESAGESAMLSLYAILDEPRIARWSLPTGETLTPSNGFVCVCTSNEPERLRGAIRDRLATWVAVDYPSPAAIERLGEYGAHWAKLARESYAGKVGSGRGPTYRQALAMAQMHRVFPLKRAVGMVLPTKSPLFTEACDFLAIEGVSAKPAAAAK